MTTTSIERTESEIRAAARRRGLTMKELAAMMGVSAGYLSQIANGGRPWTPKMREKVAAVLGEVPGQGIVYRQGGVVTGESSFIRERARTLGMTMQDLADRVGVSYSYMTQVARGRQSMGVKVQARVESTLQAPAKVAPAKCANRQGVVVAGESSYIRERARELGLSLRDLADRVGVSYSYMSMVARGHSNMGVKVQARVASALEAPAKVAPAAASLHRPGGCVGPDERPRLQPERGRPARRHQFLQPLPDHERQEQPVAGRSEEAARRPVPADEGGAGHARRGEGAGLAEGRAERDGGARRGRAGARRQVWRRHRQSRRPGALGREGGVRLPCGVGRHGPGLCDPRRRAGLLRHAEAAGAGCRLETRGKDTAIRCPSPGAPMYAGFLLPETITENRCTGVAESTDATRTVRQSLLDDARHDTAHGLTSLRIRCGPVQA